MLSNSRFGTRRVGNFLALITMLGVLCFTGSIRANPLASSLLPHTVIAGPNQGNPQPQRTASTPVGTLPASFQVDDRGSANISIPIEVPPAARGLQPQLSVEYDSQLGNGPLGVGWRLAGLSAITRCGHTLAVDGEVAPVRMSDNDGLCLDGQRLMLVEGSPLTIGAVYRPKRDDFTQVRLVASDGATSQACEGGYGFEARRRDGTIATYGCRRDAVVNTHLGPRTWELARVSDRFGNYIDYRYNYVTETFNDGQADVEHYLAAIDYGAHLELHAPTRHVRFSWESRPDPFHGYMLGAPQHQSQRLRRIATFSPDGVVHYYELEYDTPSISGRSLLQAIRQCDAVGVCKPETTFSWSLGQLAFEPLAEGENFNYLWYYPYMDIHGDALVGDPAVVGQAILDANGDGRTDMLLAAGDNDQEQPSGRGWEMWLSQPSTSTNPGAICGTTLPNFQACADSGRFVVREDARTGSLAANTPDDSGFATPSIFATDYDGDGRDDAIALGPEQAFFGGTPPAGTRFYIARSKPEGGVEQFEFDPVAGNIWWFTASDQTGDGLGDLLFCGGAPQIDILGGGVKGTGSWFFIPNVAGEGFDVANRVDTALPCTAFDKFLHLDHDGDGVTSLLVIPVWDTNTKTWVLDHEWSNYHALRLDPFDGWAASLEDTGLPPDLAQRWRPGIANNYNRNWIDDDFPKSLQGFGLDKVIDVNGDDLPDVLRYELSIGDTAEQLDDMMQTIVVEDPPLAEWGGVRLWVNTGAGFSDGGWLMQSDAPGDRFFRRFLASAAIDYNADGRLDYLTPVDNPSGDYWNWSIWTSNGDSTFVEWANVLDAPLYDLTDTARANGVFDLDGDGLQDAGIFFAINWMLWDRAGEIPDKIVVIEDGLGARFEVKYRSLTDIEAPEGFYDLDLEACVYPERCERSPQIVVERHFLDNGVTGQAREFEHRYGVARTDREGRRALGFESHSTIEWADVGGQREAVYRRKVSYNHVYEPNLQDFPYAGVPAATVEDYRDPVTGRHRVTSVANAFNYLETTPVTYHRFASQTVSRTYELPYCPDTFCNPFFDFDEQFLINDTVDTVFEIDGYGNPLVRTSSADTGPTILIYRYETSYQNDPGSWLLGLPTHQTVYFLQSGIPQRSRETVASYFADTGALQARITEPTDIDLFLHEYFSYDEHGNLDVATAVDAELNVRTTSIVHDAEGVFPIISTNGLGQQSTLSWDRGLGVPVAARDPNDLRTVVDYDGFGRITGFRNFASETPRGDETTIAYVALQAAGDGPVLEIVTETDGHGHGASQYDRRGRVVLERELDLDGVERFVATEYDHFDRVRRTSLRTPVGQAPAGWEEFEYDFAHRLAVRTLADGTSESWTYDGLEVEHVDIGGSISKMRYDTAARLLETTRAFGTPDEERVCFDYGAFELVERVRPDCVGHGDPPPDPGDAPATIKTFDYDDRGQLIASMDPSEGPRSYFYNGHGEIESVIDGNGNEVIYTRDMLGRVTARTDIDGVTKWKWDTDLIGVVGQTASPSGHEEYRNYDEFGRLEVLTKVISGEFFELGFEYDGYSRLSEIHYPSSGTLQDFWVRNTYAANGQLLTVRSGPDDGLLWSVESLSDAGQVTTERFGENTLTQRTYDPLRGFVETITTTSDLGGTLQNLSYVWNGNGTLQRRDDLLHGQHENFGHDHLHRIGEVHTTKGQQAHSRYFTYDSLGNIVFATDRGEYDYDSDGRLQFADGNIFSWDDNGNLVSRTGNDPALLTYTAFDKVSEIETGAGLVRFEYDAWMDRVYRYSDADARETIYVTDLYQRHHDEINDETEHHYYVPGQERIVANVVDTVGAISAERDVHFVHVDHLGSTDVVSDASGMVEHRKSYDVWGKERDPSDWTLPDDFSDFGSVNLGYTGHEAQEDGGLINMQGRMYDPQLGRMMSADPFVSDPTSAQGWNRYAYVLNRPLGYTDPSGFTGVCKNECEMEAEDVTGGPDGELGGSGPTAPDMGDVGDYGGGGDFESDVDGSGDGDAGSGDADGDGDNTGTASDRGPTSLDDFEVADYFGTRGGTSEAPHPLLAGAEAIVVRDNPGPLQQSDRHEQRRQDFGEQQTADHQAYMADPGTHVTISLGITMFFLGGDAELLAELGGRIIYRRAFQRAAQRAGNKWLLCFPEGTAVMTPEGAVDIEDIEPGDIVFAFDLETGSVTSRAVTAVSQAWAEQLVELHLANGTVVQSTAEHPFWVVESGAWVNASDVFSGSHVLTLSGEAMQVDYVGGVSGVRQVFNLIVDVDHSYFAGDSAVLVHNGPPPAPPLPEFDAARNAALEWLNARGFRAEKQVIGKFGPNKGKPIGMSTADGKIGFRIEYETRSGAHINVFAGKEKGPHFQFKGNQRTVNNIVRRFQCP